jgi:hypothetical protein
VIWNVLVRSSKQPDCPQRATDANQQDLDPLKLDDPSALPIE